MWCGRWDRSRRDSGATAVEYAAAVLVSIAVIVGILAAVAPRLLSPRVGNAVCKVFQDGGCAGSPPSGSGPSGSPSPGATERKGGSGGNGGPTGPSDGGKDRPGDRGPHWNDAYAGMSPGMAAFSGFGHQVGKFFGGVGSFFKDAGAGVLGGIWGDLVGLKDLVVHPVNSVKGIWWAITHPTQSVPMLVWDDKSREDWGNGKKVRAVFRGVWNVGSWFIPYYDIGKGISKIGKFGKVADEAGKAGRFARTARLAKEAEEAAARAREAARNGDVPAARKAAQDARRKADEAGREAKRAGCRVGGLGPPPTGRSYGRTGAAPALLVRAAAEGCDDAARARRAAEEAARRQRAAERAQKLKDIDDALAAKRYEDADRFSGDLERMAADAEARAAKDPTPENRKEAQDARAAAEKARNRIVDQKIADNLTSSEANVRVPAQVARDLRSIVRDFEKKYGPNGRQGEIDIETGKAIIEVANGASAKGKVSQATRNKNNPVTNPQNKPIIIYAPNMKYGAVKNLRLRTGVTVVQTMDELREALRRLGEPVP